ncbi:MAG: outer membrane protein assembly factor BamE [Candidatus Omnitrophica bacterium]|nr:outer membrane protein assembly factor BamE [Candidatus Omnitrophota bacterium]
MKKKMTLILGLFLVFLTGCATTNRYVEGRDFDAEKRTLIIKSSSTKADVIKILGEPMDKGIDDKYNEFWSYFYVESDNEFNIWTSNSKGTKRVKKLIVVFDDKDVVRNYVYSDTSNPVKFDINAKK